ncbi:MAG: hypothetical protein ACI909_003527 [Planctomycetota bacterium]
MLVAHSSGGSMGTLASLGIYGLFNIEESGASIIPLKYFDDRKDAFDFIIRQDLFLSRADNSKN